MTEPVRIETIDAPLTASRACATLRIGGCSTGPHAGTNLAAHVGDDPVAVRANRAALSSRLGLRHVQWMNQTHGTDVFEATVDELDELCEQRPPGRKLAEQTLDVALDQGCENRVGFS